MLQQFTILLFLFFCGINTLSAQIGKGEIRTIPIEEVKPQKKKKKKAINRLHYILALGGGANIQVGHPIYSLDLPALDNQAVRGLSPFGYLQAGFNINNRHELGWRIGYMQASSSFHYTGEYGEGLGLNKLFPCTYLHFYYQYNLLPLDRFWLGPVLQIGGAFLMPSLHNYYDTGQELNYNSPQGSATHEYRIIREDRFLRVVFPVGVGLIAGVELIPYRFSLSLEASWINSINFIHQYEVSYEHNGEELYFTSKNRLSTVQLGLRLTYILGDFM